MQMHQLEKQPDGYRPPGDMGTIPVGQPAIRLKDTTKNRVWMVAEDDPVLRSILKMMLTLWEVDALVFADGNEAWDWLDEVERGHHRLPLPEVALLDIRMPGHLGYEVGARMRSIVATRAIPLLIMTAYHLSDQDKAQIYASARPEHLVAKPFPSLDEFRSLIETIIAISKTGSAPIIANPERAGRADRGLLSLKPHQWRPGGIHQNRFSLHQGHVGRRLTLMPLWQEQLVRDAL